MRRNRSCKRSFAIISAAIGLCSIQGAWGAPKSWIGNNGSWSIAAQWSPNGPPIATDQVTIARGAFTLTYDNAAGDSSVDSLRIDNGMTLTQGSTHALTANEIDVGSGTLAWNAGTINFGSPTSVGTFSIGAAAGGTGTFAFSGGVINGFSYEYLGGTGNGVVNQTGGINNLHDSNYGALMIVGNGGAGTYNLSAGTINATTEYVGYIGAGTFNQTGGIHNAVNVSVGARNAGTYLLSGGTLNTVEDTFLSGDTTTGSGTFINSGGFHQTPYLYLGDNSAGTTATYILSGAGALQTQQEYIANAVGTCTILQTGGTHTVSTETSISEGGNFKLQGGTYTANTLTLRQVQANTTAPTFTQTGGVATIAHFNNGTLTQYSYQPGGTFNLSGGTFTAIDSFIVGGTTSIGNGETFTTTDMQFVAGVVTVAGANSAAVPGGTLAIGAGGLVFGGNNSPTIVMTPGSSGNGGEVVLHGDVSFTALSGTAGITAFTIAGTTVPVVDLAGGNRTFNIFDGSAAVDLSIGVNMTDGAITKTGTGEMVISGNLDNTIGSLTVNQGTLALGGSNSFIGAINLNGGTLSVNLDYQLGNPSNPLAFNGGALQTAGDINDNRTITIGANGGTFDVVGGTTHTIKTSIAGSSIFGKTGEGTLALTTNNAVSGTLTVQRGTVKLAGAGASLPSINTVGIYPLSTFDLDNSSGNPTNTQGFVNDAADVSLNGGTFTYLPLSGGASSETFHQLIPAAGGSTIVEGAAGAASTLTFSAGMGTQILGATLDFEPASSSTNTKLLLTGQATGFIGGWATENGTNFAAYDTTNGVVPFTGETATLGINVFFRPTAATTNVTSTRTINTLNLDCSSSDKIISIGSRAVLSLADGGLIKSGDGEGTISGLAIRSTDPRGEFDIFTQGGDLHISAAISNNTATNPALIKSGRGNLELLGQSTNTYLGMTEVHAGTLTLDRTSPNPNTAIPGDLLIDGGAVVLGNDEQINDNSNVTISAGTLNLNTYTETINSLTNSGGTLLTGGGILIVNSPHTTTLSAGTTIISGGSLNSTGMLVTGGVNTVQAGGVINVGTTGLTFSLNKSPTITLNADATTPGKMTLGSDVSFTGSDGTAYIKTSAVGTGQSAGVLDLGGARTFTVSDGAATTDMEISATIINGALVKSGTGLLRLTATNTYSGGTTLNNGTIEIVNPSGLGSGSVTFNGGFLSLESDAPQTNVNFALAAGATATITVNVDRAFTKSTTGQFILNQAAFGARFNLSGGSGGSLTIGNVTLESANVVINNSIPLTVGYIGGGGFEKTGAGTFTLLGEPFDPNSPLYIPYGYTGTATVDAGVVELNNPSGTTVQSSLVVNGPGTVRLLANDQIQDTAPVTLNGATGAGLLDLNGFSDKVGSVSFIAGGVLTTGAGTLIAGGNFSFTGASGSGSLSGNLNLGTATRTFTTDDGSAADDMVVAANISGSGGIIKAGPGQLRFTGSNSFTGGVTVNAGTLLLSTRHTLTSLALTNTAAVEFAAGGQNASLILAEPTIASGAQIDTTNTDLLLRGANMTDVRTFLHNGYANSTWTGTGGMTSTTAAGQANSAHKTSLAYLNASLLVPAGSPLDGVQINSTDILIRYAAAGDANLDGVVNALDFNALATNYGSSSGTGKFWRDGDFNYDGNVNSSDFDAVAGNFGYVFSATGADPADGAIPLGVLTPEPSTALLFSLIAGSNWTRRRRRRAPLFV